MSIQITANVTGRDSFIVAKALAYAIEAIELLPVERREQSDQADMKKLLDHMIENSTHLEMTIDRAKAHLTGKGW